MSFKYERLPNICYWCGCLTHSDKDCDLWLDSEGTLDLESHRYGAWMHAPPFSPTKKATIFVSGFYANRKGGVAKHPQEGGPILSSGKPYPVKQKSTTPSKVALVPTPNISTIPKVVEIIEEDTDVPLGFEEQLRKGASFVMVLNEIDQELTKFDLMEGVDAIQDSIPFQKSSTTQIFENSDIPCILIKPTWHTPLFSSNCNLSSYTNNSSFAETFLFDVINHVGASNHVIHPPVAKWTRALRVDSRNREKLDVHAGLK